MPCEQPGHFHPQWPKSGPLTIERCEVICQYCTGADAQHHWKHAWFLRRHVRKVHIAHGEYPDVDLANGWTHQEDGLARPSVQKKRPPPRSARRDNSKRIAEAQQNVAQLPLPDFSTTSLPALPTTEGAAFNDFQTHHLRVMEDRGNDVNTFNKQSSLDIADTIEVAHYSPVATNLTLSEMPPLGLPQHTNTIPQTCSLQAIESSDQFTSTNNFSLPIDVAGIDSSFLLGSEDFGTPPPVPDLYNSPSSTPRLSLSPITTPQHRRGANIEAEEPLTPLSIEFTEVLRQKLNEVTGLLGSRGGRASVLLAGMQRYARNFQEGTEF